MQERLKPQPVTGAGLGRRDAAAAEDSTCGALRPASCPAYKFIKACHAGKRLRTCGCDRSRLRADAVAVSTVMKICEKAHNLALAV